MNQHKPNIKYVAFLRGINVGGHHKVPMADLRNELAKLKLENVQTLLNSGNAIFESYSNDLENLETTISERLETTFGFSIPTILIEAEVIYNLLNTDPFKDAPVTKDIRLYISFLKNDNEKKVALPWVSEDNSYQIITQQGNIVLSVLDLSVSNTPKGMNALEKLFGKDITTRNWNTIIRIEKKL